MNFLLDHLLREIEETRVEMVALAYQFGFSNPAVVNCSQRLDSLINAYHMECRH